MSLQISPFFISRLKVCLIAASYNLKWVKIYFDKFKIILIRYLRCQWKHGGKTHLLTWFVFSLPEWYHEGMRYAPCPSGSYGSSFYTLFSQCPWSQSCRDSHWLSGLVYAGGSFLVVSWCESPHAPLTSLLTQTALRRTTVTVQIPAGTTELPLWPADWLLSGPGQHGYVTHFVTPHVWRSETYFWKNKNQLHHDHMVRSDVLLLGRLSMLYRY